MIIIDYSSKISENVTKNGRYYLKAFTRLRRALKRKNKIKKIYGEKLDDKIIITAKQNNF